VPSFTAKGPTYGSLPVSGKAREEARRIAKLPDLLR
jgi:hypothetical protein